MDNTCTACGQEIKQGFNQIFPIPVDKESNTILMFDIKVTKSGSCCQSAVCRQCGENMLMQYLADKRPQPDPRTRKTKAPKTKTPKKRRAKNAV